MSPVGSSWTLVNVNVPVSRLIEPSHTHTHQKINREMDRNPIGQLLLVKWTEKDI